MGYLPTSLPRKAAPLVSDLTTLIFNPISDISSEPTDEPGQVKKRRIHKWIFSYQMDLTLHLLQLFLSHFFSTDSSGHVAKESKEQEAGKGKIETASESIIKEHIVKKGLLSRGKRSVGKAILRIALIGGYGQISEPKADDASTNDSELVVQELEKFSDNKSGSREKLGVTLQAWDITVNNVQKKLALPWLLSTGANHYFTLCSPDYLAMGGGGHFALYLDVDLLNGSSYQSETYGNRCLAHSEDFKVKELWGFVYPSKYEEMLTLCRTEKPGIWSW